MIQWLRRFLKMPDEQPCVWITREDIALQTGPTGKEVEDCDVIPPEETEKCAEKALGAYEGKPDLDLKDRVAQALCGVIDPLKKLKNVQLVIDYVDGTQTIFVAGSDVRVFIDDPSPINADGCVITIDRIDGKV